MVVFHIYAVMGFWIIKEKFGILVCTWNVIVDQQFRGLFKKLLEKICVVKIARSWTLFWYIRLIHSSTHFLMKHHIFPKAQPHTCYDIRHFLGSFLKSPISYYGGPIIGRSLMGRAGGNPRRIGEMAAANAANANLVLPRISPWIRCSSSSSSSFLLSLTLIEYREKDKNETAQECCD